MAEHWKRAIIVDGSTMINDIAKLLSENGYVVAAVFTSESVDNVRHLASDLPIYTFVVPKSADIGKVLEDAGIRSASIVLALSNNDEVNLRVAELAREKFGVPKVIVLASGNASREKLESMGVIVVDPVKCAVGRIMRILRLEVASMVNLVEDISVALINITIDSRLIGRTLEEIEDSYGVSAVVKRGEDLLRDKSTVIEAGDQLIVVGRSDILHMLSSES